jgi:beta-galactosidase/beta-glucuronidase
MEVSYLEDWKFRLDSEGEPWRRDFDDSGWEEVIVPHDWAVSFPFSPNYSSGTGYLPGGSGWYRTVFPGAPVKKGRRVYLHFDGVYKRGQVWCNGYYLGGRASGFCGFSFDITHCLHESGDNVIALRADHRDFADSRWYTGSGILRKAYIVFQDPVFIPQNSIIIESRVPNQNEGTFAVSAEAVNGGETDLAALTADLVINGPGDLAAGVYTAGLGSLAAGRRKTFTLEAKLAGPRLWSPESPSLYTITLSLSAPVEGGIQKLHTALALRAGIRSIYFDPDRGFFLNGEARKIKGVCVHDDAGCLGAAVWPEVWRRRLEKLKAAGCNAIRMSHNPHMDELYGLCDELGFLVMEEAFDEWEGCKNKWSRGHNVYPPVHEGYYEDFPLWHERDLTDMVLRGRNHPSIILWSIGNEIDYPNDPYVHPLFQEMTGNNDASKPKEEMVYNPQKPNMERLSFLAAELAGIVKKYDKTRPVLAAAAFPELSSRIGFFDSLDAAGYNYKEHLYPEDHRRFPRLPIIGSENGHSLEAWKAVEEQPFISGQFLWTGGD